MAKLKLLHCRLMLLLSFFFIHTLAKSTIEPCSVSDSCTAMVGYTLSTDLKVSEVATLFQVDPISLLSANAYDPSSSPPSRILPAGLFLKVPFVCSCVDGIRSVASVVYHARASDTLESIATSVYGSLVSADQIRDANGIADPELILLGQPLRIPLPCSCFNRSDNGLPAIYLSYVVRPADTLMEIATTYSTTLSDLMAVNALGGPVLKPGDILAIPLAACIPRFSMFASDAGLMVANGSYAITADHCVQCSCGPVNMNLFCAPASLGASCESMHCRRSNLTVGSATSRLTSAGCNVTSCTYGGFVNGSLVNISSATVPRQSVVPVSFAPAFSITCICTSTIPPTISSRRICTIGRTFIIVCNDGITSGGGSGGQSIRNQV
ncbi:LysM domain-containing GPI-anchored protein 1 [Nymphaea thermarum]|nr:LysM domain-containing GPI-anchored protein 1 [Nymphaea thermarum]